MDRRHKERSKNLEYMDIMVVAEMTRDMESGNGSYNNHRQ